MISWNDSNYFIIRNLIIKVPSKIMVFRCISDRDAHRFPPKPNRFYTFILHLVFFLSKEKSKGDLFPSMYERSYSEEIKKYFGLNIQQKSTPIENRVLIVEYKEKVRDLNLCTILLRLAGFRVRCITTLPTFRKYYF